MKYCNILHTSNSQKYVDFFVGVCYNKIMKRVIHMKTIDLVVPCYNEEAGLEHFVLETNKVIDSLPDTVSDIFL